MTKSKSWNLLKSRSQNLSGFQKIENVSITKEYNLASKAGIAFIKLR